MDYIRSHRSNSLTVGAFAIILIAIITVTVGLFTKLITIPIEYSNGQRTGVITKISKKGFLCKTYEGQLNLGSIAGSSDDFSGVSATRSWEFTVYDESLVPLIEKAADSRKPVTLEYKQYISTSYCSSDTGYLVTGIKQ